MQSYKEPLAAVLKGTGEEENWINLEAKLYVMDAWTSLYWVKKVDLSDFSEVLLHFCFLLEVRWKHTSITENMYCWFLFKLHLHNYY